MKWTEFAIITCLASLPALAQTNGPGSALSFNGSGYLAIATTGSLTGTFTVELWAKPNEQNTRALISSRFLTEEFGFDLQLGAWLPNGIPYAGPILIIGDQNVAVFDVSSGRRCFRLHKP